MHCTEKIAAGTASIKLSSLGLWWRGSTNRALDDRLSTRAQCSQNKTQKPDNEGETRLLSEFWNEMGNGHFTIPAINRLVSPSSVTVSTYQAVLKAAISL